MTTAIAEALRNASARLTEAGIERSQAEARLLLEAATGLSRAAVIGFPERALTAAQAAALAEMVERRARREPVSRILGRREFWSLSFEVGAATLDPRPDSETLVGAVLARIREREAPLALLDLGTGTGCLLLALLSELQNARGTGVDISADAIAVAERNAAALGLAGRARFVVDDWAAQMTDRFDIVISNPPYIESDAIGCLSVEVAVFDPRAALDGGSDGLEAYRKLLPVASRLLKPGGVLALEIGAGQGPSVRSLAMAAGFRTDGSEADLAGIERCLLFRK